MRANNDNKGEKKLPRSAAEINASSLPHLSSIGCVVNLLDALQEGNGNLSKILS